MRKRPFINAINFNLPFVNWSEELSLKAKQDKMSERAKYKVPSRIKFTCALSCKLDWNDVVLLPLLLFQFCSFSISKWSDWTEWKFRCSIESDWRRSRQKRKGKEKNASSDNEMKSKELFRWLCDNLRFRCWSLVNAFVVTGSNRCFYQENRKMTSSDSRRRWKKNNNELMHRQMVSSFFFGHFKITQFDHRFFLFFAHFALLYSECEQIIKELYKYKFLFQLLHFPFLHGKMLVNLETQCNLFRYAARHLLLAFAMSKR